MLVLCVALMCSVSTGRAVDARAPLGAHLGVASCAGSTCHGRQEPTGAVVRQDELLHWQDEASPGGAHSRAWRVLTQPRGRAIAQRLGIAEPQASTRCIGCHADNAAARGPNFQLSDGVGCEACHGGAGGWIAAHAAMGTSHTRNIGLGMRALDNPAARADTCLDCHFGSDRPGQFVTHDIMAAGHPRISFELDLFSTMQQHWTVDADYRQRKEVAPGVRVWAVGQARALVRALSIYGQDRIGQPGSFPEFTFFDCQTCHRTFSDAPNYRPAAQPNPGRPMPPGTPAFQDENMIMLSAAAAVAAPEQGARFDAASRDFHAAIARDRKAGVAAAARLRAAADALQARLAQAVLDRAATFRLIDRIARGAVADRYTDYEGSAQAVMAVDTLLSSLVREGAVSGGAAQAIRPDIERAYAAVRDANSYQPAVFRTALGKAADAIGTLW